MNKLFYLLLFNFLLISLSTSCSSQKELIDKHIVTGSCDENFKKIELSTGQALWANIEEVSGNGASYMVTGLGYSTDVIVTFTGGILGTVAACSPFLIADVMANANGSLAEGCVIRVSPKITKTLNPNLGDKTFEATAKWRCPHVESIAEALLDVAECYQAKGENALAKEQIEEISSSAFLNLCLSSQMKEKLSLYKTSLN